VFGWLPGLRAVKSYQRAWLTRDVVAGVVLSTLLVPQGMAYAELAGLPPITGLYTSILCLLGYAVFGPSRILVLGPDSSLGPMIAATILPLAGAGGDPKRAVALASMLAIIVGAIMIAGAVAKIGFIADLISKPTQAPGGAPHGRGRYRGDDDLRPQPARCQPGGSPSQGIPAAHRA
jgi:MFS superfamily sulfate permease-like transporter